MSEYIVLSAILFTIGCIGVLTRRNALVVFMCVELMLNACNLSLVAFANQHGNLDGQVAAFFVMVVAAAEVVIGLASPRLMAPRTLSTPLVCCSMPRACRSIPVADVPHNSAASSIRAAGTPVISAAHAGVMSATAAAAWSKLMVCSSMNSWSSQSRRMSSLSTAPKSAESLPGRTGR